MFPLIFWLCACEKEEKLWELPAPQPGETVASVDMGNEYDNAVFYSLKTGATQTRNVYSWHLAFATGANEHHIVLNGGNEVQVYSVKDTVFEKTYKVEKGASWLWDNPNGKTDSTALAGWMDTLTRQTNNQVYMLDLGSKASPRYKKLKILSVSNQDFTIEFANPDGSELQVVTVPKISGSNYTYMNIATGTQVPYEPNQSAWNFVFTKYRYVYYDMEPITPYYVTGVLINPKFTQVVEQDDIDFESLNASKAAKYVFSHKVDEIGYDWKKYDLNGTGKYVVDNKKVYILKDADGTLYKLKFIGFYNEKTGAKGVPKFVYKRL